jgi:hypothetical protein
VTPLGDHLRAAIVGALDSIPPADRDDAYVVSLFVYDEEDDPRRPTVTVGFNTESQVAREGGDDENRWNYAFFLQNQLAIVCDTDMDPAGASLRESWAREQGLWYGDGEPERTAFDERGAPLTKGFVDVLVEVVQGLHSGGDVERIFDRPLPVLIHELEYYDAIARQNLRANPPGVADAFTAWIRSM